MTSTGFWQVNLIKNGNKFSKLDLFENMEDANNSARKFWDQFDKEGLSESIISDEPNQPYDGFQCVDNGGASFKVYVEECHVNDLKVPQLKLLAKKKNVDVKGLKKAEILKLLLPLCQQEIKENPNKEEEKNKETENNNNNINENKKENTEGNSNEISQTKSRPKRKLSVKKNDSDEEYDDSVEKEDKDDQDYEEELPQMIKIKKTPKKKLKVDTKNKEDKDNKKSPSSTKKTTVKEDDFDNMKIVELRDLCTERGLKKSGTKAQLIERLKNPDVKSNKTKEKIVEDYNKMKIGELKELCREAGVKVAGTKSELIIRLMSPNKKENRPNPLPFGGKGRNHQHGCILF